MSLPLETRHPLIVILGPTAVGKTEVAIQLAQRLDGEIISADSRLFYRGMDIGTAKPTADERMKVPHHLIDVAEPDDVWSLAVYQDAAYKAIADIVSRRKLPMLVGGTGQYIHAVIEAWEIPDVEPDPRLRSVLENWVNEVGPEGLHARLANIDPSAAEKIDPKNVRRTVRALEVILTTGQQFSTQRRRSTKPFTVIKLGLIRPRQELYKRIDTRIESMMESGFLVEVKTLLRKGYSPDLSALSAIGYREIIAYLRGRVTLEEAIMLIKRQTRIFVRRQANWFKQNDPDIRWFHMEDRTLDEMEAVVRGRLRENFVYKG